MIAAVIIPDGHVALGKLAQALIHGAKVVPVRGSFDDALHIVRELGERGGVTVVNSINPFRIEGQKTAAFEICDALGEAPDVHCIPVGNAGNITAYWKGYGEYARDGIVTKSPRMLGWQAAGSAPLVLGEPVLHPETIATAIRIGNPASWDSAIAARDESGGRDRRASPTPRSSTPTGCWPRSKGCSSSPRRRPRSPGLLQARRSRFAGAGRGSGVHGHRPRSQGPEPGDRARSSRSPPSTRNVEHGARGARPLTSRRSR